ncbi:MAG TPA: rod shape-determining protein MreC [Candidatus Binatia bacterium]|nr:rod shape-determining protein MreC [Candidatus Binatia bacterium]
MSSLGSSHRRPLFPKGPGLGLKAITLCALALGLLFTDQRSTSLAPVRDAIAWGLRPVMWAAGTPSLMAEAAEHLRSRESLLAENQLLREDQQQIAARLQKLDALEMENRRLQELLSSSTQLEEKVLVAEILSAAQDPYRQQVVINKGARDGVYRGQALVDAYGVLGQVTRVNPQTAVALLITDPNHGIPVQVNRTGLQTIALGHGDARLSLPYLPGNADVREGDLLVSSSIGGRFPDGYPVGQVQQVRHTPGEAFMEAIAQPVAQLNRGRHVLLVWSESFPVAEPAPAEDSAKPPPAPPRPVKERP